MADTKTSDSVNSSGTIRHGLLNRALEIERHNAARKNAIVENDGVFSIQKNIETSGVEQDPFFKDLVESVLNIKTEDSGL